MAKNYDNELKDLYDTGTSDRDIEAAKQKQKAQYEALMKQGAAMGAPAKEEEEETPMKAMMRGALKANSAAQGMGPMKGTGMKKGGKVKAKCMASGGKVSQLSKANGIAVRGKSRGRII